MNPDLDSPITKGSEVADAVPGMCLTVAEAAERADAALRGTRHPLPRASLDRWDAALTEAWQALSLVHAGVSEARRLPDATPTSVGDVLGRLRAARTAASQAAREAARLRWRIAAAEDRLRRLDAGPAAQAAADRWRTAAVRLDLVTARLAVGTRSLDRYAEWIASEEPVAAHEPAAEVSAAFRPTHSELTAGVAHASGLVLRAYPYRGRRGFLARLRRQLRKELRRELVEWSVRW